MSRPKQVVPLFLGGAGMWVVHLMLVGTSRDADPMLERSSSILGPEQPAGVDCYS